MIKSWLSEKSTWLGFFAVAASFGFELTEPQQYALAALGASLMAMRDR